MKTLKQFEDIDKKSDEVIYEHEQEGIQEAEYQGKKVKLNDPIRGGSKKFYVYVKDGDKVKKVSFHDTTGLSIKRDDPARRKSFRARHNCDNPGTKNKSKILVLLPVESWSKGRQLMTTRYRSTWHLKRT